MTPITNYNGACKRLPLRHPFTKDKSPQPNDRTPVKEIHRCPNTKWAAVTRPRQQGTRIAMPTTAKMEHAPLHSGISQVKASLANKHRRRSHKSKRYWPYSTVRKHKKEHIRKTLTHLPLDKMASILQTTSLNAFSSMKMFEFRLKFHWSLFLWV